MISIFLLQVRQADLYLFEDLAFPREQLFTEVFPLTFVHERLFVGRSVFNHSSSVSFSEGAISHVRAFRAPKGSEVASAFSLPSRKYETGGGSSNRLPGLTSCRNVAEPPNPKGACEARYGRIETWFWGVSF